MADDDHIGTREEAIARYRAAQAEIAEITRKLQDPAIVHNNMLRGIIAPITIRQAAHVAGGKMIEWLNEAERRYPPPSEKKD